MLSKIGRMTAVVLAPALLAGCWFSEADMFAQSDFATVDLDGDYSSEVDYDDNEQVRNVRFTPEDDGRYRMDIDVARIDRETGEQRSITQETLHLSFVAIPGAPERWYLMQGIEKSIESQRGYLLAHINESGVLELYVPNCSGTPQREGMAVNSARSIKLGRCDFEDKQALLDAAREAAQFVEQPQIVVITPFMAYKPKAN